MRIKGSLAGARGGFHVALVKESISPAQQEAENRNSIGSLSRCGLIFLQQKYSFPLTGTTSPVATDEELNSRLRVCFATAEVNSDAKMLMQVLIQICGKQCSVTVPLG